MPPEHRNLGPRPPCICVTDLASAWRHPDGRRGCIFDDISGERGVIFALLNVNLCLRGTIFDAISGEGVRFPAPLKTTPTDAMSDEGVAFCPLFRAKGLHF